MVELCEQVALEIAERELFHAGEAIVVAVSGGSDSMALLAVLTALSRRAGWALTVAHLNHALRGRSSDADQRLVERTAGRLGLPVVAERAEVRAFARTQKLSLEMAARQMRHAFLARVALRSGSSAIALAHHADDQMELFFLRLLRGSGSEGLGGMKWSGPSPENSEIRLVRPFLGVSKAALLDYARRNKLAFREDATNRSIRFQRNRIRHQLLPLLKKSFQPALSKILPRVMETLQEEGAFVSQVAQQWLAARQAACRSESFEDLPVAVQRRCLQLQLFESGLKPEFELVEFLRTHPEQAISFSCQQGTTAEERPKSRGRGRRLIRRADGLLSALPRTALRQFDASSRTICLARARKTVEFEGVGLKWRFCALPSKKLPAWRAGVEYFDGAAVGKSVVIRHWRPGDRFQLIGMARSAKLQDIFTNQKILRSQRHRLLVAATEAGELFWVEGLRISEHFKLSSASRVCLQWQWHRPTS